MTTALLIIDVQQALCTGKYAAFDIDNIIGRINTLGETARSSALPVFIIQHEEDEESFRYGSPGWQLAEELRVTPDDVRLRKTTPDSFHRTPLHELLQQRGVTRLVIVGLQTDFCIDTTVRRALSLGYAVTLVSDAHTTLDNDVLTAAQIIAHHNATLAQMMSFGPRIDVLPTQQVRMGT